jgi:hypothetical protein
MQQLDAIQADTVLPIVRVASMGFPNVADDKHTHDLPEQHNIPQRNLT